MRITLLTCIFTLVGAVILRGQKNEFSEHIKENIGAAVNDEADQILPVFSPDGTTLYFSQLSPTTARYEVWFSQFDPTTRTWSPKQRQPDLNPDTEGGKYVFNVFADGTMLVSGKYFKQPDGRLVQSKGLSYFDPSLKNWQTMTVPSLEERAKGRFLNAFYHQKAQVLLLSFTETDKKDLYVCLPEFGSGNGKNLFWREPVRLPPPVNSVYDDTTPFLDADGKTLFFASNRPGGFGEEDIYRVQRLDDSWQRWSQPENLGFSINSNKAEIYFTLTPSRNAAYFVSYKHSVGSGDVFKLTTQPVVDTVKKQPTPPRLDTPKIPLPPVVAVTKPPVTPVSELREDLYAPNNLVFLIDISASMEMPTKLPILKQNMTRLIGELRAVDNIALITFADSALMRYAGKSVNRRDSLLQIVSTLQGAGATKANEGLSLAYNHMRNQFIRKGNNEILLATDGRFKLTPEDEQRIANNRDITLSVIAFGNNEKAIESLKKLANQSGGSFLHIRSRDANASDALLEEVKRRSRIR
jgi:hypothetical protein